MPTVLFTTETASEMGRKGGLAARRITERTKPSPSDRFQAGRLKRVRVQLKSIDDRLEAELAKPDLDAQLIDRLAAASMRLSDQEFALAGRAKPANAKVAPASRRPAQRPPPRPVVAEPGQDTTTPSEPSA